MKHLLTAICALLLCASGLMAETITVNPRERQLVVVRGPVFTEGMNIAPEFAYYLEKATGTSVPVLQWNDPLPENCYAFKVVSADKDSKLGFCEATWECDENSLTFIGSDGLNFGQMQPWAVSIGSQLAVFDWLDRTLGIRWIWPGELGEVIPHADTITLTLGRGHFRPHFKKTLWFPNADFKDFWVKPDSWNVYVSGMGRWYVHHMIYTDLYYHYYHAFNDWFRRFGGEHPDFFSQLPDGTRRPDPHYVNGSPEFISMCVSNPEFHKMVAQEWLKNYDSRFPMVNLCENDTAGLCTCERCLAWDESPVPAEERLAEAKRRFEADDVNWYKALGPLTRRYLKYYQAVKREVDRIAPEKNADFAGLIYSNYVEPIEFEGECRLNDRFYLQFCPFMMFPLTEEKVDKYIADWNAWTKSGAQLLFRPNFPGDGHCFPINYSHAFARCFKNAYEHGMIGGELDSNTGNYINMATTFYMIARLHSRPDMPEEEVLQEFYGAFGSAKDEIRNYFDYLAELSEQFATNPELAQHPILTGGSSTLFVQVAHKVFTTEVYADLQNRLDQAIIAANGDERPVKRIQLLKTALKHAELTSETQKGYEQYKTTGNKEFFDVPYQLLNDFRLEHEHDFLSNLGWLRAIERWNWIL